jgi:endonuclease/exonuclease/phosphatase family metal-dependent hydrolase
VALLRVATWNCQHGRPDPDALAGAAKTLDVDVLAIQEVDRGSARVGGRDLAVAAQDAVGGSLVWAPALTLRGGGSYGNAVLVRGEVLQAETVRLPGRRRVEPRVAALARVVVGGRAWSVAATHLSTRSDVADGQLVHLLDVLRRWPAPRVLLGDLNLQPGQLLPWLTAEGYRLGLGPPTFPARRPARQIDHVAVAGRGCTVRVLRVEALAVGDHCALVAEIRCLGG